MRNTVLTLMTSTGVPLTLPTTQARADVRPVSVKVRFERENTRHPQRNKKKRRWRMSSAMLFVGLIGLAVSSPRTLAIGRRHFLLFD